MLHRHCLLESIVPLSRFMINYAILHDIIFTYIYIYIHIIVQYTWCHMLPVFHHGCRIRLRRRTPERLGDASPVLSTGSTGAAERPMCQVGSMKIHQKCGAIIDKSCGRLMTILGRFVLSQYIYIYPILRGNYHNP